ncbi:hypothetical protein [Bathymodiolus japonicus methanotrophic gill symbiont]|nr:hypothetical protein [Bathymodiolus japonicus methanotrophic gill symbiont]
MLSFKGTHFPKDVILSLKIMEKVSVSDCVKRLWDAYEPRNTNL